MAGIKMLAAGLQQFLPALQQSLLIIGIRGIAAVLEDIKEGIPDYGMVFFDYDTEGAGGMPRCRQDVAVYAKGP